MTPDDVKALRKQLEMSSQELATRLGVSKSMIASWERGEAFPTKKNVVKMLAMEGEKAEQGEAEQAQSIMEALGDHELWALLRKILRYPELREELGEIAQKYSDPLETRE